MTAHGRHISCIVVGQGGKCRVERRLLVGQQGIGVTLLVGPHLQLVARVHVAHLDHLLARAPVNHARRRHIVIHHVVPLPARPHQRVRAAASAVHQHLGDLAVGRQRVVIHLHRAPHRAAIRRQHPYQAVCLHMAQAALFHIHAGRVEQRQRLAAGILARSGALLADGRAQAHRRQHE